MPLPCPVPKERDRFGNEVLDRPDMSRPTVSSQTTASDPMGTEGYKDLSGKNREAR
jgi:hypothetical protein